MIDLNVLYLFVIYHIIIVAVYLYGFHNYLLSPTVILVGKVNGSYNVVVVLITDVMCDTASFTDMKRGSSIHYCLFY